ncbi:hypothetical protein [Roseococcus sp. YIM B11640]|uniref:hypothetical protein n=1 Tax=Roseococcus sp. YIM B11640 TaxID=3133973 RepID=UPI003C7AE3E0
MNEVPHAVPSRPREAQEHARDVTLSEFDAPRMWMPAGELSLITVGVFLLVALIVALT